MRRRWLGPLSRGEVRAGLALGGLRPGPPTVRVRPVGGGYVLDGQAPWVTGWGMVDVLLVAGRDADDTAVWLLVDVAERLGRDAAGDGGGHGEPDRDRAVRGHVRAGRPVHRLDAVRAVARTGRGRPAHERLAGPRSGPALLPGPARPGRSRPTRHRAAACRDALDRAGPADLPAARAAAAALAFRAAGTLMVDAGAGGVLAGEPAELAVREAAFLLVFGSRPEIRTELLARPAVAERRGSPGRHSSKLGGNLPLTAA